MLVTVEEIVDVLEPRPGAIVLPNWTIDCVAWCRTARIRPTPHGYTERDNDFYVAWDAISRDRDGFRQWMEEHVLAGLSRGPVAAA